MWMVVVEFWYVVMETVRHIYMIHHQLRKFQSNGFLHYQFHAFVLLTHNDLWLWPMKRGNEGLRAKFK